MLLLESPIKNISLEIVDHTDDIRVRSVEKLATLRFLEKSYTRPKDFVVIKSWIGV